MSLFSDYLVGNAYAGQEVRGSNDLARILALPRRQPLVRSEGDVRVPAPELLKITEILESKLSKGDVPCNCEKKYLRRCARHLLPVQAWALYEVVRKQGLFGPIGVGDGKTLLDLLTPMVMPGCQRAVLLVPNALKRQLLEIDWGFYGNHWHLPNLMTGNQFTEKFNDRPLLYVVAYSELSGAKSTGLLEQLRPDTIIADEGHNLRYSTAARTKRFLRRFQQDRETRLCIWSGTLVRTSLRDYAHLSALALGDESPTPLHMPVVEEWAAALDPVMFPAPPGELQKLNPGGSVLEGWHKRLTETEGVVCSPHASNCDASLVISERPLVAPENVLRLIQDVERKWQRPDGEELVEILAKVRCERELSAGFYYRWIWPRGESRECIDRWLAARKAWRKELREKLQHSTTGMDSELLVRQAAHRWHFGYEHEGKTYPNMCRSGPLKTWDATYYPDWYEVEDTCEPETEAVWVDEFLARDAANWLRENVGIAWYEFDAFGRKLAELSGAPLFGEGTGAEFEDGSRAIVASARVQGVGKNLQMFSKNLVANPLQDWEQVLGRTHRQGQMADEVTVEVYRHTDVVREALDKGRRNAQYVKATVGGQQKLTLATFTWTGD